MNRLNLLDTSITTDNLGDQIICESIMKELENVLKTICVTNVSTHDYIGDVGRKAVELSPLSLLMGTNALASKYRVNRKDMWRLTDKDVKYLAGKVLLCGVGWRKYHNKISFLQKKFYRKVLNSSLLHSVRDSHSAEMLGSIGIKNVVNTTCPTAWSLTPEHCEKIHTKQAARVVFTLTRHKPDPADAQFIQHLLKNYEEVFFWPQQFEDATYLKSIVDDSILGRIKFIAPSLKAFDEFLAEAPVDFVGTRLHGGIRAMQYKQRTIIIGIDNRALEIAKDIDLPVVQRGNLDSLHEMICNDFKTEIKLPAEEIRLWKQQFESLFT